MTSQIFSWRKIIDSIKGTIFLVTCMLESMKIENLFQFPVGSSGTSILCSEDWAFFVKKATFSCQAFRTRWTQGWGDAPLLSFINHCGWQLSSLGHSWIQLESSARTSCWRVPESPQGRSIPFLFLCELLHVYHYGSRGDIQT